MRAFLCSLFGMVLTGACAASPQVAERFAPCADAADFAELEGTFCAPVSAPLSHDDPNGERIDLFVRQFPATGRSRGQVWLVAGGPGESGATFYGLIETARRTFPHYDLLVPDHRGTGYSAKLCPAEEAPQSAGGLALEGDEWARCIAALHMDATRTRAFTITNAARDLALLIDEIDGPGRTYVYGVSYGTQVVLRMMQTAPPRLDGIILDSIIPPEGDPRWDLSRRTQTTDAVGRIVLSSEDLAAYERVLATRANEQAWRSHIPDGDLKAFMGALLDFPELRARMPAIVAGLQRGDMRELDAARMAAQEIGARLSPYPQSPPSLPLVSLISASENNARPNLTASTVAAESEAALFTSPLPGYLVDAFPPLYERDEHYGALPTRLPRTLIIQGGLDPKTPIEGARVQAQALQHAGRVQLVEVGDAPHFVMLTAPERFTAAVSAFLNESR